MDRALSNFVDLAIQGRGDSASEMAQAARELAAAVMNFVPYCLPVYRDGLRGFVNLAAQSPCTARDLVFGEGK